MWRGCARTRSRMPGARERREVLELCLLGDAGGPARVPLGGALPLCRGAAQSGARPSPARRRRPLRQPAKSTSRPISSARVELVFRPSPAVREVAVASFCVRRSRTDAAHRRAAASSHRGANVRLASGSSSPAGGYRSSLAVAVDGAAGPVDGRARGVGPRNGRARSLSELTLATRPTRSGSRRRAHGVDGRGRHAPPT